MLLVTPLDEVLKLRWQQRRWKREAGITGEGEIEAKRVRKKEREERRKKSKRGGRRRGRVARRREGGKKGECWVNSQSIVKFVIVTDL